MFKPPEFRVYKVRKHLLPGPFRVPPKKVCQGKKDSGKTRNVTFSPPSSSEGDSITIFPAFLFRRESELPR